MRLENLDSDLRPPQNALEFTKNAVDEDEANSYLPFFGLDMMRQAAANLVGRPSGQQYDWKTECIISAGGLSGILKVLLATLGPGDEVLLTDPIHVGLINRVRLAEGVQRLVPLIPSAQGWRLGVEALAMIDPKPVLDGATASRRLLEVGKIAATPMVNWGGADSNKYLRFVFANEPVHRLRGVAGRIKKH